MGRFLAFFFGVSSCALIFLLFFFGRLSWPIDYKFDISSIATLLAVVVALAVALRDGAILKEYREHRTLCFVAYNRPAVELILKRVASAGGVIEGFKKIRLGAVRPYDAFRTSSIVVGKSIWTDVNFILESISALPIERAEMIASALGNLPMLKSDYETLAMMESSVPINETDQDLIGSILDRSSVIVGLLKAFLALSQDDMDELVNSYREVVSDGVTRRLVTGFCKR